jgi:hypothetical protein
MTLLLKRRPHERTCRGCGCTDSEACPGGCAWVLLDIDGPTGICSTCAQAFRWHPALMAAAGVDDDVARELLAAHGFELAPQAEIIT